MSKILNLIQNENMKIYRRPRTWIMVGIIIFFNLAMALAMLFFEEYFGSPENVWHFMYQSTGLTFFLMIFTVVIASESVAAEFSWGTIKLLLIRPVQRWKILLSKYISALLFALFLLVMLLLSSLLLGLLFGTGGNTPDEATFAQIMKTYGYNYIELLMTVTFAFMISAVFRSSILAISLAFVIMFVGSTISGILIALKVSWGKYLLFTNMDLTIYEMDTDFDLLIPGMSPGFSIAVLAVYFIVFHIISFLVFTKRDVSA